jgi:hypothetical protein
MSTPAFADPLDAARYVEYRQAQEDEYGAWVAAHDIRTKDGVLAFTEGQSVPRSTVDAQGWEALGMVRRPPIQDKPGVSREEQIKARLAQLDAERQRIEEELAAEQAVEHEGEDDKQE